MNMIVQGFPIFLLIFCRITAFFVVSPIFSSRGVPNMFKLGLGFFLSLIVFMAYGLEQNLVVNAEYMLMVIREVLIGILMGFVVYLFFAIVQTAGGFIDMQIGFAMANIVDPHTGMSQPLLGNFKYMLMMVIFLAMNGHHYLLNGLLNSYEWIPLDNELFALIMNGSISEFLVKTFSTTFMLAIQVAAPLVIAMFLTDVGLGFLTKSAPQFNVFVVGIPIKIILGVFLLVLLMPGMSVVFGNLFTALFDALERLFAILQASVVSP